MTRQTIPPQRRHRGESIGIKLIIPFHFITRYFGNGGEGSVVDEVWRLALAVDFVQEVRAIDGQGRFVICFTLAGALISHGPLALPLPHRTQRIILLIAQPRKPLHRGPRPHLLQLDGTVCKFVNAICMQIQVGGGAVR